MWEVVGDFFHSVPPQDLKWNSPNSRLAQESCDRTLKSNFNTSTNKMDFLFRISLFGS